MTSARQKCAMGGRNVPWAAEMPRARQKCESVAQNGKSVAQNVESVAQNVESVTNR